MMYRKTLLPLLFLLLSPPLVWGTSTDSVLGNEGEIYRLLAGTAEELFPAGSNIPAENHVLVLEVEWPNGETSRRAVPGTRDAAAQISLALLYEKASSSVVVAWKSPKTSGTKIRLVSYDSDGWSEVETVGTQNGDHNLELVITRDAYEVAISADETYTTSRSILHFFWHEEVGADIEVLYTPIILVEGRFLGWNPLVSLTRLSDEEVTEPAVAIDALLTEALDLAVARDGRSVRATFAHAANGTILSLEVGILPLELGYLSEEIRDAILDQAGAFDDADLISVSGHARNIIINIGHRFSLHPAVVDYVANEVTDEIVATGTDFTAVEPFADAIRDYAIDLVSTLLSSGMGGSTGDSGAILEIDVGDLLDPTASSGQPAQILDLRTVSSRPAPELTAGPTQIFTSPTGRDVLIAWDDPVDTEGTLFVHYVESTPEGWSEMRSLAITETRSQDDIHTLLAQRVR